MPVEFARLRDELVQLIESDRHLLIGAKALIQYTRPRFTQDTDYAVEQRVFRRVRKWFRDHADAVSFEDVGEALRCPPLAIDVVNATNHPVRLEVIRHENGLPSPEGLAAFKYVAMTSLTRPRTERIQDFADFSRLVVLDAFDIAKLTAYLVDPYDAQRDEVTRLIADIRAGRPVQI